MTCQHAQPFPEHCGQCNAKSVRLSAQQAAKARIMRVINMHFAEADTHNARAAIAKLREELRTLK